MKFWNYTSTKEYVQEFPSVLITTVFFTGYLCYYFIFVAKVPYIACHDKRLKRLLVKHCPILHEKFRPTVWCFESRMQTILRSFIKSSSFIIYESELLTMPDGGQVLLDWAQNHKSKQYPDSQTRPTIVLLPGLTGTSGESYVLHLVAEASKLGFRTVVFNNRGMGSQLLVTASTSVQCNPQPLKSQQTPRTYCAANSEDLTFVIKHVRDKYPDAPLMGTGVSLGGMILFNYLAKTGKDCGLMAGMIVSVAWNVFESVNTLEIPGLNKHLLNRTLAKGLVNNFKRNLHLFEPHFEDVDHVIKSTTIREFDDRFTAPMFGYSTWQDYYKDACLHDKIHALQVPVLCLSAADDPFSPYHAIPVKEAEQSDNICIVVTSHGGHIGFMEGIYPRHAGYMDRLFAQYVNAVFKQGDQYLKQD